MKYKISGSLKSVSIRELSAYRKYLGGEVLLYLFYSTVVHLFFATYNKRMLFNDNIVEFSLNISTFMNVDYNSLHRDVCMCVHVHVCESSNSAYI